MWYTNRQVRKNSSKVKITQNSWKRIVEKLEADADDVCMNKRRDDRDDFIN